MSTRNSGPGAGTDNAFLAAVGGALADAAAAGAVTDTDTAMAYIKQLVTAILLIPTTAMRGTDNAFLAAVGGALDDAAAAGAVTDSDTAMAYLKQLVTAILLIPTTAMRGTDDASLASVLGALNDAEAAGAVTDADTAVAYLKQIVTAIINIEDDTGTSGVVLGSKAAAFSKLAGERQVAITTEDLNQAVGSYDLFFGTTKPCMLTGFSIKQPTTVTSGALTSIKIHTDDATESIIVSVADGDVTNLLTESELSWDGRIRIETGTKIQLTIAGGATGVAQSCEIVAEYYAIEDAGYLAPQEG